MMKWYKYMPVLSLVMRAGWPSLPDDQDGISARVWDTGLTQLAPGKLIFWGNKSSWGLCKGAGQSWLLATLLSFQAPDGILTLAEGWNRGRETAKNSGSFSDPTILRFTEPGGNT